MKTKRGDNKMLKKFICIVLVFSSLVCVLSSCETTTSNGEEISSGETTVSDDKEIFFNNGKEIKLQGEYLRSVTQYGETIKVLCADEYKITAKLVLIKELLFKVPGDSPDSDMYVSLYQYRLYVEGYCSPLRAGEKFKDSLVFRMPPATRDYFPTANYSSSTIQENGYFEFSADIEVPSKITHVLPVEMRPC